MTSLRVTRSDSSLCRQFNKDAIPTRVMASQDPRRIARIAQILRRATSVRSG